MRYHLDQIYHWNDLWQQIPYTISHLYVLWLIFICSLDTGMWTRGFLKWSGNWQWKSKRNKGYLFSILNSKSLTCCLYSFQFHYQQRLTYAYVAWLYWLDIHIPLWSAQINQLSLSIWKVEKLQYKQYNPSGKTLQKWLSSI